MVQIYRFLPTLILTLLLAAPLHAQHNPVYSGTTSGGGGGGGATTSSGNVTRPTNAGDNFAVGAGNSGAAPLYFNQSTGTLEINVAGGGVTAPPDASLGGTLVLQEGTDDNTGSVNQTFTIGISDTGLASSYTCTLQSDGTWLPANCPFNAAAGTTLAGLTDTSLGSPSNNDVLTYNGAAWTSSAASGGSDITVQEEGVSLSTAATTLNFTGTGVTASGTGATKTINISGGGSSGTVIPSTKIRLELGGTGCPDVSNGYGQQLCIKNSALNNTNITAAGLGTHAASSGTHYDYLTFPADALYSVAMYVVGKGLGTSAPEGWCISTYGVTSGGVYKTQTNPVGILNDLGTTTGQAGLGYSQMVLETVSGDRLEVWSNSCADSGNGSSTSPNTTVGTADILQTYMMITRWE